jgi:hypothetical protein
MDIRKEFVNWLKQEGIYDDFEEEVLAYMGFCVDDYLHAKLHKESYPGSFISEAFIWPKSVTQKPVKAYKYWYDVNERWRGFLKKNNVPDKTHYIERVITSDV